MIHYCEFVTGAQGESGGDPVITQCEAPASIRTQTGRWLCADHYDIVDDRPPIESGDVFALD